MFTSLHSIPIKKNWNDGSSACLQRADMLSWVKMYSFYLWKIKSNSKYSKNQASTAIMEKPLHSSIVAKQSDFYYLLQNKHDLRCQEKGFSLFLQPWNPKSEYLQLKWSFRSTLHPYAFCHFPVIWWYYMYGINPCPYWKIITVRWFSFNSTSQSLLILFYHSNLPSITFFYLLKDTYFFLFYPFITVCLTSTKQVQQVHYSRSLTSLSFLKAYCKAWTSLSRWLAKSCDTGDSFPPFFSLRLYAVFSVQVCGN